MTRTLIAVAVVLIVVVAALAYYYQPVRGTGYASPTTIVKGNSVQFGFSPSQGFGPYKYLWSFGDGSTISDRNPTHTYGTTGTYTVSVLVTDQAGMKCSWSTKIIVRLALVFIDTVSYPSWVAFYPLGDTYCNLFVDGSQVIFQTASLQPGTTHSIRIQVIGVADYSAYGGGRYESTLLDERGTVTAPTTQADLHCTLNYNPLGSPMFTLTAA